MEADTKWKCWLERLCSLLILAAFAVSQYALRMNMFIYSDDAVAQEDMRNRTHLEYIRYIYQIKNGKVLADPLGAFMGQWEFGYWALVDVLLYVLVACLVAWLLRTLVIKASKTSAVSYVASLFISCLLIMCLPVSYLLSAGFILTSTNYAYTSFGIIFCLAAVMVLNDREMKAARKVLAALLGTVGTLYASNQEQTACILGGALMGYLLTDFFRNGRKINKPALLYLVLDGGGFLFMLLSPGHIARSQERGGLFAVPDYASWTFADKISGGIATTFANVYFQPMLVFTLLCVLLFLAALLINRKVWTVVSATVLLLFAVYEKLTDYDGFVTFYDYSFGLPDLDGSVMATVLVGGDQHLDFAGHLLPV